MELIRDRLATSDIQSYRTAYRTLALNIGGPSLNSTRILFEDGNVFSETDLLQSTNLYFLWLLTDFIPFANSLGKPWMIVNGDAFMFDKIDLTPSELSHVQARGLVIFMYEPLFLLNKDRSWPWTETKGQPVFVELDDISKLQHRWQAPVDVCVCELELPQYLKAQGLYPNLNVHGFSTLLLHEATFRKTLPWPPSRPETIDRHLLSLNFRFESVREMLVSYLSGNEHLNKCYVSFFHHHDEREFLKRLPFDPHTLSEWSTIERGMTALQDKLPLVLDSTNTTLQHPVHGRIPDMNGSSNQRNFDHIKEYMTKSFAFAYCESRPFSPRGEISEKTLDAIQAMKPFVVYASPYFLKTLHSLGFKTFSAFWNEDYDLIENPKERFDAYLKVIDFICSQNLSTLQKWTRELRPIVEHNRLLFLRHLVPQHIQALKNEL